MAVKPLSDSLKRAGRAMLSELDDVGLKPQGVLWLHFHELRDWRLTVVSDLVNVLGRHKLYSLIDEALEKQGPIDGLTIFDVHLADSSEVMPRVLGGAFRIGNGVAELIDCRVNDVPVDAVVYRLCPPRSKREITASAKRFERTVKALPEKSTSLADAASH